jgi:hypothetical protein
VTKYITMSSKPSLAAVCSACHRQQIIVRGCVEECARGDILAFEGVKSYSASIVVAHVRPGPSLHERLHFLEVAGFHRLTQLRWKECGERGERRERSETLNALVKSVGREEREENSAECTSEAGVLRNWMRFCSIMSRPEERRFASATRPPGPASASSSTFACQHKRTRAG